MNLVDSENSFRDLDAFDRGNKPFRAVVQNVSGFSSMKQDTLRAFSGCLLGSSFSFFLKGIFVHWQDGQDECEFLRDDEVWRHEGIAEKWVKKSGMLDSLYDNPESVVEINISFVGFQSIFERQHFRKVAVRRDSSIPSMSYWDEKTYHTLSRPCFLNGGL
jgi:hypothetical protein